MAQYKLFSKKLTGKAIDQLGEEFTLTYATYLVTIIIPKDEICILSTLQYRTAADTPWTIAASNVLSEKQEITVEVGIFNPELTLSLTWAVHAVTKISNIAVFLGNKQTGRFIKLAPAAPKTIEKGKPWVDEKLNISLSPLSV